MKQSKYRNQFENTLINKLIVTISEIKSTYSTLKQNLYKMF